MKRHLHLQRGLLALALSAAIATPLATRADDKGNTLDVGNKVPEAAAVKEGLFPEDACKELEANGFKCMGFKPAIKYSLPASSFRLGSAEIPDLLRKQLDVFADVLKSKKGTGQQVRVIGHADATGTPEANLTLSLKRAQAVKEYLVDKGADPQMLIAIGQGAKDPLDPAKPYDAVNRRVEIGRDKAPTP